jgi:hypothetical protein
VKETSPQQRVNQKNKKKKQSKHAYEFITGNGSSLNGHAKLTTATIEETSNGGS